MKRISVRWMLFVLLALSLLLLPAIFPFGQLRSPIKERLGRMLQEPVQIKTIDFRYLPAPALILHQMDIEGPASASIGQLRIPLTVRNLLGFGQHLHEIHLQDVTVSPRFVQAWRDRIDSGQLQLPLKRLVITNGNIQLGEQKLGSLRAQFEFSDAGLFHSINVGSPDEKLSLHLQPKPSGGFSIQLSAKHWEPFDSHPVILEYLTLQGILERELLHITDLQAGLYNGQISGSAKLSWDKEWLLTGNIQGKNIQAEPFLSVFNPSTRASGKLQGKAMFRFKASNYPSLLDRPILQGQFSIADGTLHNIDLVSPLKSSTAQTIQHGGQTRFDRLDGVITLDADATHLRQLQLDAGKLRAQGSLAIRDGQLSGGARVALGDNALAASTLLTFSGTLAAPELQSGGSWRPQPETDVDLPESLSTGDDILRP